jgi:hypothetical protein
MLETLALAAQAGRLRAALSEYVDPDVLVIDEVGYLTHRPDAANVLYHVINERHLKRRPMLLTTNKPPAAWGNVLHDADLAEAILDRVLERGRLFELRGSSYRTRHVADELRAGRGGAGKEAEPSPGPQRIGPGGRRISGTPGAEFPEPTRSRPTPRRRRWARRRPRRRVPGACAPPRSPRTRTSPCAR